ncbi:MAG: hypothetical protein KJN60_06700 [Boseongicola sp.]|nr:hypothetical protein [Boseongicola sp.]
MSPLLVCLSAALVSLSGLLGWNSHRRFVAIEDDLMWLGVAWFVAWGLICLGF